MQNLEISRQNTSSSGLVPSTQKTICGYPMSTISIVDSKEVVLDKSTYYMSLDTFKQILVDAESILKKNPKLKPNDRRMLGTIIKQVDEAKGGESIFKIAEALISRVCKTDNKNLMMTICQRIYITCFKKVIIHHDNCTIDQLSVDCANANPQPALSFKIVENKRVVFDFKILNTNNETGFVSFTDHFKSRLFLRPLAEFNHGAQKKLHEIDFVWVKPPQLQIELPKQTCLNCSSELGKTETTLLAGLNSKYIIKAPDYLGKVLWPQNSCPPMSYQYMTDKAYGTFNVKYVITNNISHLQLLKYFHDLAMGLKYLHENNLVHSDLKPDNILIFKDGIKIADFGSCMSPKSEKWGDGITIRSPEIMMKTLDGTTFKGFPHDIFAFGATIFELASPGNVKPPCISNGCEITQDDLYSGPFQYSYEDKLIRLWPTSEDKVEMFIRNLAIRMMLINPEQRESAGNIVSSIQEFLSQLNT